jgi:hypothetical protein
LARGAGFPNPTWWDYEFVPDWKISFKPICTSRGRSFRLVTLPKLELVGSVFGSPNWGD